MHLKVTTTNIKAFDILLEYCKEQKIEYNSLIIGEDAVLSIKEPSSKELSNISRFIKSSLSTLKKGTISAEIYIDSAVKVLDIDDLDI